MPAVCFCCWDTFIPCVRTRFNVLFSRDSQFLIISLILYCASKSRCFSSSAGEAVRSQLAGRQPVEQPGRVTPALESGTSKWLHAHVPAAAGTGCPAFHSTATERIWPQPWQKGGVFLLPGIGTCSRGSWAGCVTPSPGSELCRAALCCCKTALSGEGAPDH